MAIHIEDFKKCYELLRDSRDEIGRVYGPRVKDKYPLYYRLDKMVTKIEKEMNYGTI